MRLISFNPYTLYQYSDSHFFFAQISRYFPRVEFLAGDRILVQKEKEKFIVDFYVLHDETSHEETLGLSNAETVKKGTKKCISRSRGGTLPPPFSKGLDNRAHP